MSKHAPAPEVVKLIDSDEFTNSPHTVAYWNIVSELKKKRGRAHVSDRTTALAIFWLAHGSATVYDTDGARRKTVRELVGLPNTQIEFAEFVNMSDRWVRKVNTDHRDLVETTQNDIAQNILGRYRLPTLVALGESASVPDPKHNADRKLLLQMTGDSVDKTAVHVTPSEKGMTMEQWREKAKERREQVAEMMDDFDDKD